MQPTDTQLDVEEGDEGSLSFIFCAIHSSSCHVEGIFVGDLPSGVNENDIRLVFKEFGEIHTIKLDKTPQNPKKFGFVYFVEFEPVDAVMQMKDSIVCLVSRVPLNSSLLFSFASENQN
jgi:RNA recognition motif-containing protein